MAWCDSCCVGNMHQQGSVPFLKSFGNFLLIYGKTGLPHEDIEMSRRRDWEVSVFRWCAHQMRQIPCWDEKCDKDRWLKVRTIFGYFFFSRRKTPNSNGSFLLFPSKYDYFWVVSPSVDALFFGVSHSLFEPWSRGVSMVSLSTHEDHGSYGLNKKRRRLQGGPDPVRRCESWRFFGHRECGDRLQGFQGLGSSGIVGWSPHTFRQVYPNNITTIIMVMIHL